MLRKVNVTEVGYNEETGKVLIKVNPKYYRPAEVDILLSDPTKARRELNWRREYSFQDLVKEMTQFDCNLN